MNDQPNAARRRSVGLIGFILFGMQNWRPFRDLHIALEFSYPSEATDGEPVEWQETQREGMLRVHILAPRCREVYFEVTKYESLTPEAEYQRHAENLPDLFERVTISELKATHCAALPAYEYMIEWEQGRRMVILVQRGNVTYRILFNPRFPVNMQILSTLEWLSVP